MHLPFLFAFKATKKRRIIGKIPYCFFLFNALPLEGLPFVFLRKDSLRVEARGGGERGGERREERGRGRKRTREKKHPSRKRGQGRKERGRGYGSDDCRVAAIAK